MSFEGVYNIKLPKPKPYESQNRPPLASELLRSYCVSRGYVASSGLPDETKAARFILKDYIDGKLPHYEMPPGMSDVEASLRDAPSDASESDESDSFVETTEEQGGARLDDVMDDLKSFDMANGLGPSKGVPGARKKVASSASYKQHKSLEGRKTENGGSRMMEVTGCQW